VSILLTPKRLQLYQTLMKELENFVNKKPMQRFHLISGIQGIRRVSKKKLSQMGRPHILD
jgi:hypothetical protein